MSTRYRVYDTAGELVGDVQSLELARALARAARELNDYGTGLLTIRTARGDRWVEWVRPTEARIRAWWPHD